MRKLFGRKLITMTLATAVLTAAVLSGCGSPAEPGLPENGGESVEKWRLFSEAQWRVVAAEGLFGLGGDGWSAWSSRSYRRI